MIYTEETSSQWWIFQCLEQGALALLSAGEDELRRPPDRGGVPDAGRGGGLHARRFADPLAVAVRLLNQYPHYVCHGACDWSFGR